ncbi:site-specific integrase [Xenorhabdus sp. SGI246]|uniref:site-specific integrase n=1 Tax=Xenorhabdus sp. SGI246 TaxID=3158263 RepID=UPI00349F46FD
MKKLPIRVLVRLLEQELIRMGYKEATLNYYREHWKRIIAYFDAHDVRAFSELTAMQYVDKKCDFFAKEKAGLLTQSNLYLFRIVRMMGDFQQHGTVLRRYHRSLSRINSPENTALLSQFGQHCKNCGYAVSTTKGYGRTAENFVSFTESHNLSPENLTAEDLTAFVKTLMGYSYKMVEFVLCGLRCFLRFLYHEKRIATDFSDSLSCMQARKQTPIPSVWKKDDLLRLLAAIDRGNPSGKRDYAIILLVTRLGLRCIDVKHLTFSNFNWTENYLELSQSKTKRPIRLPLLKDVGWAVIDYLQNGRPVSDSPCVFLRHIAPITPFSDEDHLHQMIVKHMRVAKLPVSEEKKVGMHSLRHTLATTLMEQQVPVEEIADILGHQSTRSTSIYLKSSLKLLCECALSPEVE